VQGFALAMKTCPTCEFDNGDEFPTCVMCNQQMVDVPSWTHADPDHPEHMERAVRKMRSVAMARQIEWAIVSYVVVVAGTTTVIGVMCLPGGYVWFTLAPWLTLLCSTGSAIFIALGVARAKIGQFAAAFLQGIATVALILYFGYLSPLFFFVIPIHIIAAFFLSAWIDLICDMNR
jgi:cation transport ATPase